MSSPAHNGSPAVPYIDEATVASVLRMEELIPAMEQALIDFSAGRVPQPVRSIVPVPEHQGFMGVMPAVYADIMGAKLVNFYPENGRLGIPTHLALICVFRSETGEPIAVLDGRLITEMRTAAVTAAAAKLLAPAEARSLAILGSGVQARAHYGALSLVRKFVDVRAWSRNPENARTFAGEIGAAATSAEDAVREADVVITATSSSEPVLKREWLKPGAFLAAVGAVGPTRRELDDASVLNSAVVVDSREAARIEAGDILLPGGEIDAELGEVLAGKAQLPKRRNVLFKSLGLAVEDLASARIVLKAVGLLS